jgi:hypothetical protein
VAGLLELRTAGPIPSTYGQPGLSS